MVITLAGSKKRPNFVSEGVHVRVWKLYYFPFFVCG